MATITHDLSRLPLDTRQRIVKRLQDEDCARRALAEVEQAKVKRFYDDNVSPGTTKSGFGPVSAAIVPYFQGYLRRKYGDTCFQDDDFFKWVLKQEERFRVREVGTKVQVGYSAQSCGSRFHKRYTDER